MRPNRGISIQKSPFFEEYEPLEDETQALANEWWGDGIEEDDYSEESAP